MNFYINVKKHALRKEKQSYLCQCSKVQTIGEINSKFKKNDFKVLN